MGGGGKNETKTFFGTHFLQAKDEELFCVLALQNDGKYLDLCIIFSLKSPLWDIFLMKKKINQEDK